MADNGASSYHRFLQGDLKAIEELVRAYSDELIRYAFLFVRDSATAEDVMEDTFATLLIKRKRFVEHSSFKAYLYRIARNKCMDYLRSTQSKALPLDDLQNVLSAEDEERALLKRERDTRLYRCMQSLPTQYRDVLHLTYFEEFSVQNVAKILRKSKKQTYNLLARAKASLKEILQKDGFEYEDL